MTGPSYPDRRILGNPGELQTQQMMLRRLKLAAQERVGPSVAHSITLDRLTELVTDTLVYRIQAEVLAERIESQRVERIQVVEQEFTIIDGPYQRWRQRHSNTWWLRWRIKRRPVRCISDSKTRQVVLRVEVEDYAKFPEASVVYPPELGRPVFLRTFNEEITEKEI